MTCSELTDQITDLTSQSNTLLADVANQTAQINSDYNNLIGNDNYGGTYAATPVTTAGLQARIQFLTTRNPPPQALIAQYSGLMGQSESRDGSQAALTTTNSQLGSMKSQYTEQQCEPPL